MSISRMFFWMSASLVTLVTISILFALSAANTVPGTKVGSVTSAINANALKPTECASLNLTTVVIYPASASGAANLVLGTSSAETISSLGGNDCVVGGGGDDDLSGGNGTDILLGGPGNDTLRGGGSADDLYGEAGNDILLGGAGNDYLNGGTGTDVCTGGGGTDTYDASCETQN